MSVYARYKRQPDGFRALVELLETTPVVRRQKMIEIGRIEDLEYTEEALKHVMTFEDVISMPDLELAELIEAAPARMTSFAISHLSEDVIRRFLRNARPRRAAEIRDYLEENVQITSSDRGGAQLKLIEISRSLERRGAIRTKQIPNR